MGHKDLYVTFLIQVTSYGDGPETVYNAAGLPAIGAPWNPATLGWLNDSNPWMFRWPTAEISLHDQRKGEAPAWYEIECLFSTKPLERCLTTFPANPINEPPKISGAFTKFTREALADRFGNPILSSSMQQYHGQLVERDFNTPSVVIEMNFSNLGLSTYAQMVDTVNSATLWGMPPRTVKLSNVKWVRKLYSVCTFFYNIIYEFDCNFETFDRTFVDKGTRVLLPGGNAFNPDHFALYKDRTGEPSETILDGSGNAYTGLANPITITAVANATNPGVTTATAHGFSVGQDVMIKGATFTGGPGSVTVNGQRTVGTVINANNFTINLATSPGTYSGGGICGSLGSANDPGQIYVEFYDESNFLLLGIPSVL